MKTRYGVPPSGGPVRKPPGSLVITHIFRLHFSVQLITLRYCRAMTCNDSAGAASGLPLHREPASAVPNGCRRQQSKTRITLFTRLFRANSRSSHARGEKMWVKTRPGSGTPYPASRPSWPLRHTLLALRTAREINTVNLAVALRLLVRQAQWPASEERACPPSGQRPFRRSRR